MARLTRVSPVGLPVHVYQRNNWGQNNWGQSKIKISSY